MNVAVESRARTHNPHSQPSTCQSAQSHAHTASPSSSSNVHTHTHSHSHTHTYTHTQMYMEACMCAHTYVCICMFLWFFIFKCNATLEYNTISTLAEFGLGHLNSEILHLVYPSGHKRLKDSIQKKE